MIDIFGGRSGGAGGGIRGPRGPRGAQGRDGPSGIKVACTWLGNSLLDQYRKSEEHLCLLIQNLDHDLLRTEDGRILEWNSRCRVQEGMADVKKVAKSLKNPSRNIVPLTVGCRQGRRRYALDLNDNIYSCENVNFFPALSSSSLSSSSCTYLNICVSFKTNGGHARQVIASSYHHHHDQQVIGEGGTELKYFREISADATGIYIEDNCGTETVLTSIQYDTRRWCTLFVEWFHITAGGQGGLVMADSIDVPAAARSGGGGVGRYTLFDDDMKKITGDFKLTSSPPRDKQKLGITLGGREDGTVPFSGLIASLEIYLSQNDRNKKDLLPEEMKSLLMGDCHVVTTN